MVGVNLAGVIESAAEELDFNLCVAFMMVLILVASAPPVWLTGKGLFASA